MKGAPKTKHEIIDEMKVVIDAVDQHGREMDQRWGFGMLPRLVPIEWAERFRSQRRKWLGAVWDYDADEVRKHGEAMIRAYAKLDEIATAERGEPGPVTQWEFDTPEGLVILVQDKAQISRAQLHGRKAQVWSIDELASVLRAYPTLAAVKDAFPGSEIESIRVPAATLEQLDDDLMEIPL